MTPVTRLGTVSGLMLGLAAFSLVPTPAAAGVGWLVKCPYDHSLKDDPIKFPGQPGASHLHDFFGNESTNAGSTYKSMVAAATRCGTPEDTAGYWVPALYRNGVKINPNDNKYGTTRQQVYYRADNLSPGTKVEPLPAGLKMVQGYAAATSVSDANAHGAEIGSEIYWGCSNNSPDSKFTAPVNCSTGIISLHIGFPNCWSGRLSGGDDIAAGNVVYPESGKCPATHPHPIPRVLERFEYPVGKSSSGITLASGRTYTIHADLWNTWLQSRMNSLTTNCLNARVDCGTDPK